MKFKFQINRNIFSVNMEKPGHAYTEKLCLVYLTPNYNRMSCMQTLCQVGSATSDGVAQEGHPQTG